MSNTYSNVELIEEIHSLREKINDNALNKWDHRLFLEVPLIEQAKQPQKKSELDSSLLNLRNIIGKIEKKCDFEEIEEARKIFPWIDDSNFKNSLNQLQLYLYSKNIKVDSVFFGFRKVNRMSNLITAHPEARRELIALLKKENLFDLWDSEKYGEIHNKILKIYKSGLEKLYSKIQNS